MFVELLMKKNGKLLFGFFIIVFIATTVLGGMFVYNSLNTSTHEFKKAGYTLSFSGERNSKAEVYSFKNGTTYKLRGSDNTVSFEHKNTKVDIDENAIIHYTDGALGFWKKVVGMDVSTVNKDIIFYYNIYKDTQVNKGAEGYTIKLANEEKVKFKNLLVRVSDKKFILTGKNVRLVLRDDEVVDFGDYVEFEYTDGNIVKVYNQDKYYQTISVEAVILVDDIKIQLHEAAIYKENKQYISLTNLVIDNNGNIDTLEEKIESEKIEIKPGGVETPNFGDGAAGGAGGNGGGIYEDGTGDGGEESGDDTAEPDTDEPQQEETEDKNKTKKTPVYRVTTFDLSALTLTAAIEITDTDNLITSSTEVDIIENKTSKITNVATGAQGDGIINFDYSGLKPDTEYTLTAKAMYKVDDQEFERYFVSKIFRTEDLGVAFEKGYSTNNSISFDVYKESYSKVEQAKLTLYDENGELAGQPQDVIFSSSQNVSVTFNGLSSNKSYTAMLSEIQSQGVTAVDGFNQKMVANTLKTKPEFGELSFETDKKAATFNLHANAVADADYGVISYRYEVYDKAYGNPLENKPIITLTRDRLTDAVVNIDGEKLKRGGEYTFLLVAQFNDNEKVVEYTKELGEYMTLGGATFPTIRFEPNEDANAITWEQINGTITIDDPHDTIQGNQIQVTYRNSIDVNHSMKLNYDPESGKIPINVNNLRANETYTFQVYATVDLKDDNPVKEGVYIGSVAVQTGSPKTLQGVWEVWKSSEKAFYLRFRLQDLEGVSTLEASTMQSITFTIYKGANTTGAKQNSTTKSDENNEDYVSTLKLNYYDKPIVIDPEFFDSTNDDYMEKTYTIEVSNIYDYTDHQNVIPIDSKTATKTFEINDVVEGLPQPTFKAAYVHEIINSKADNYTGMSKREDLEGTTIVGYGLTPKYSNRDNKAVYIKWIPYMAVGAFDPMTGIEEGTTKETDDIELRYLAKDVFYQYDEEHENFTLDEVIFPVGDGTDKNIKDYCTKADGTVATEEAECTNGVIGLKRGNRYYFKYEIYLDENGDKNYTEGSGDIVYPYNHQEEGKPPVMVCSEVVTPIKQQAKVKMYPSTSTADTYTWKYIITDPDYAMIGRNLYYYEENRLITSYKTTYGDDGSYKEAVFRGLTADKLIQIRKYEYLLKPDENDPDRAIEDDYYKSVLLATQYFDGENTLPNMKYTVEAEDNKVTIAIDNYGYFKETVDSLGKVDITFTSADGDVKTITDRYFNAGKIVVDYFSIRDFVGKEVTVDVRVFYDSGITGMDVTTDYVALQKLTTTEESIYYIKNAEGVSQNNSIAHGMYKDYSYSLKGINEATVSQIKITPIGLEPGTLPISIAGSGIKYSGSNVAFKAINSAYLNSDEKTIRFDYIIPGVTVNIVPSVGLARIDIDMFTTENMNIQCAEGDTEPGCGLIYLDLYAYDAQNRNPQKVDTEGYPIIKKISELEEEFLIEQLANGKFHFELYTYILNNNTGEYEIVYLYDRNSMIVRQEYVFYTKESIQISKFTWELVESSYKGKSLNISYEINSIDGFDRIEYKLEKYNTSTNAWETATHVPNTLREDAYYKNELRISAEPKKGNKILYEGRYRFSIDIKGTYIDPQTGETRPYDYGHFDQIFETPLSQQPYVGITSSKTAGDNMVFKVSISDPDFIIRDGEYTFQLVDETTGKVVETTYPDANGNATDTFKISEVNKSFTFSGSKYIVGHEYEFTVYVVTNPSNDGENFVEKNHSKSISFGDIVDVGTITTKEQGGVPSKIGIYFQDTYKITEITYVQYTISAPGVNFTYNRKVPFSASYDRVNNIYKIIIDLTSQINNLTPDIMYTIGMNFYGDSNKEAGKVGDKWLTSAETQYYYTG